MQVGTRPGGEQVAGRDRDHGGHQAEDGDDGRQAVQVALLTGRVAAAGKAQAAAAGVLPGTVDDLRGFDGGGPVLSEFRLLGGVTVGEPGELLPDLAQAFAHLPERAAQFGAFPPAVLHLFAQCGDVIVV